MASFCDGVYEPPSRSNQNLERGFGGFGRRTPPSSSAVSVVTLDDTFDVGTQPHIPAMDPANLGEDQCVDGLLQGLEEETLPMRTSYSSLTSRMGPTNRLRSADTSKDLALSLLNNNPMHARRKRHVILKVRESRILESRTTVTT